MSDHPASDPSGLSGRFIAHLERLAEHDRGALAVLRRSLTFAPGAFPGAYPWVEPFVPPDCHEGDALRRAMHLAAGLYASHPKHVPGQSLARSLGRLMHERQSPSIEKRFIALLSTDEDGVPELLRQIVRLLAADGHAVDHVALLDDLAIWLRPWAFEARDRMRQRWARDFYRGASPGPADAPAESSAGSA